MMTREHVVWAGAIWVEKIYGNDGACFIHDRIDTLMHDDDINGVEMWAKIGTAYNRLGAPSSRIH